MKSAVNEYFFSLTALFLLFFNSQKAIGSLRWPFRYTFKTAYTTHLSFHFCEHNHSGQALDRLVTVSSMPYGTSTPALSTSSSSRGLTSLRMGYLILRGASRLDAFSVYPFPTWLPGREPGGSTGTPEVSPSRSSRTKDSSSQISYAHAG